MAQFKQGDMFGKWEVKDHRFNPQSRHTEYLCECKCGTVRWIDEYILKSGKTRGCGCEEPWINREIPAEKMKDYVIDAMLTSPLMGKTLGKLTVIGPCGQDRKGHFVFYCRCVCENELFIRESKLKSGRAYSCGCGRNDNKRLPIEVDDQFGELTVIAKLGKGKDKRHHYKCRCSCGYIVADIRGSDLKNGNRTVCDNRLHPKRMKAYLRKLKKEMRLKKKGEIIKKGIDKGKTFGNLLITGDRVGSKWPVLCTACGAEGIISEQALKNGRENCGCSDGYVGRWFAIDNFVDLYPLTLWYRLNKTYQTPVPENWDELLPVLFLHINHKKRDIVLDRYQKGLSLDKIAKKHHLRRSSVVRYLYVTIKQMAINMKTQLSNDPQEK